MLEFFFFLTLGPGLAVGAAEARVVDDFADANLPGWQSSYSGEYYRGGQGQEGLIRAEDPEQGFCLRARVEWRDERASEPAFITRFLDPKLPLAQLETVSFRYKIEAEGEVAPVDPRDGFKVRLRTSETSFTDYTVTTGEPLAANVWRDVTIEVQKRERIVNIYDRLFGKVQELTFRLDDVDDRNATLALWVTDLRVTFREATPEDYRPTVHPRPPDERLDVLILQHAAEGFYDFDAAARSLDANARVTILPFRGLHFPLWGFPATFDELLAYDVVVFGDLDPYVLTAEQARWLADAVASGVGLLVCGGPNTLTHAQDFKAALRNLLPVTFEPEAPLRGGGLVTGADHPLTEGLPLERLGRVGPMQTLTPRDGVEVVLTAGNAPLLLAGTVERGRVLVLNTWPALAEGKEGRFFGTDAWPALAQRLLAWAARRDLPATSLPTPSTPPLEPLALTAEWRRGKYAFAPGWPVAFTVHLGAPGQPRFGTGVSTRLEGPSGRWSVSLPTLVDVWVKQPDSDETYHAFGSTEGVASTTTFDGWWPTNALTATVMARRPDGQTFRGAEDVARVTRRLSVEPDGAVRAVFDYEILHDVGVDHLFTLIEFAVGDVAGLPFVAVQGGQRSEGVFPTEMKPGYLLDGPGLDLTIDTPDGPLQIVSEDPNLHVWLRDLRPYDGGTFRLDLHSPLDGQPAHAGDTYQIAFTVRFPGVQVHELPPLDELRVDAALVADGAAEPAWTLDLPLAAPEMTFEGELPNLESGDYQLRLAVRQGQERLAAATLPALVVDPLDRDRFFPLMSILEVDGGGHLLDEAGVLERLEDLAAHGFNAVGQGVMTDASSYRNQLRVFAEAEAQRRGMATFYEYTSFTNLSGDRPPPVGVFEPNYREALAQQVSASLDTARRVPRLLSFKILDEPHANLKVLDGGAACRAAYRERFGVDLPTEDPGPDDPLGRYQVGSFIGEYVQRGYETGLAIKNASGAAFDLLVTYYSAGFGSSRPLTGFQDGLNWSRGADRFDFDVYPYFYPTSQKVRMVQANWCLAASRGISQHLGQPWGFYVELDDRNYPFQINPPEATAECAFTALAHGADYLNSFIYTTFGTGTNSRPERWAKTGEALRVVNRIGPLLAQTHRPPARWAVLLPEAQQKVDNGYRAPYYAFELLNRVVGEADVLHEQVLRETGLSPSLLRGEVGGGVRVLCLFHIHTLHHETVPLLLDFVRQGGLLFMDQVPERDERGEPLTRFGGWPAPTDFREDLGLVVERPLRRTTLGEGHFIRWESDVEEGFRAAVEEGSVEDWAQWVQAWREAIVPARVPAQVQTFDPHLQSEAGLRLGKDWALLIVVNHDPEPQEVRVELLDLPFKVAWVCDLATMEPVDWTGKLAVPGRWARLLALYPREPKTVEIAAPKTVVPGRRLGYTVTVRDARKRRARGQHLVEITVTDPNGIERARYGGARVTTDGRLTVSVPLATNAARGTWRIRVVAPQIGATAEAEWEVERNNDEKLP